MKYIWNFFDTLTIMQFNRIPGKNSLISFTWVCIEEFLNIKYGLSMNLVPVQSVIFVGTPVIGPYHAIITCPACRANVQTRIEKVPSIKAHLFALICCLLWYVLAFLKKSNDKFTFLCTFHLSCWCGCCLIPYKMESCQITKHFCSACGSYYGSYQQ